METHLLAPAPSKKRLWPKLLALLTILSGALFLSPSVTDQFPWQTSINDYPLGGLSATSAINAVSQKIGNPEEITIQINVDDDVIATLSGQQLGWDYPVQETITALQADWQSLSFGERLKKQLQLIVKSDRIVIAPSLDRGLVTTFVADLQQRYPATGAYPKITGAWSLQDGRIGRQIDVEELTNQLVNVEKSTSITVPWQEHGRLLSSDERIQLEKRQNQWRGAEIRLESDGEVAPLLIETETIANLAEIPVGWNNENVASLAAQLASQSHQPAQPAEIAWNGTAAKAENFVPAKPGIIIDETQLITNLTDLLSTYESSEKKSIIMGQLPLTSTWPDEVVAKNLVIRDRIGVGESYFAGSIANRVYNVKITAERLHGTIILPGDEFSFNRSVGEVSRATGYKTAYVIKDGRTQLGDGGGVCQVSTTVFRTALNAGLPITAWKPHSYRVGYYEQNSKPGLDATVYAPGTDFKFRNDTAHPIILAAEPDIDNYYLRISAWGVSDGRTAVTSEPVISNVRSAPAPLYVPDPTLAPGAKRQIDWSAPGATSQFSTVVHNADGSLRHEKKFTARFIPWQAVYLVGTIEGQ